MAAAFWNEEGNSRLLREVTNYYVLRQTLQAKGRFTMAGLEREVQKHLRPAHLVENPPSSSTQHSRLYYALDDFLHYEAVSHHQTDVLEALFQLVVGWFANRRKDGDKKVARTRFLTILDERKWFHRLSTTELNTQASVPGSTASSRDDPLLHLIRDTLGSYLSVDSSAFAEAAAILVGKRSCSAESPSQEDRQGYETYRYSSIPGMVAKTFTIFTPPSVRKPFCEFRNFYHNAESGVRKTSAGLALSLRHAVYCVGTIRDAANNTTGLKVMLLPHIGDTEFITGIVVTIDDQGRPIASRLVLRKTDARHSDQCPPEVLKPDDVEKALDPRIIRRLRNHVKFHIGTRFSRADNPSGKFGADDMVKLTAELCQEQIMCDGIPFNPAAHESYPFNHALCCFDHAEEFNLNTRKT